MTKMIFIFKITVLLVYMIGMFFHPSTVSAQTSSFVSVVNPIRGDDFWSEKDQKSIEAVLGQTEIVNRLNIKPTWLIRPDVYSNIEIIDLLKKNPSHEKGIFLEVTPSWTKSAGVEYRDFGNWHSAGSVFLTGYEIEERKRLIDFSFGRFKELFGYYPKSVGAWWIDANSLEYMQTKYKITSALIVADQYTTDDYQVWGQYWGTPYYPAKKDALIPAQNQEYKIPIVMMQWAARDPFNGYGEGVQESTYSLQANDYIDFHDLSIDYFSKLIDIYSLQKNNRVNQVVVGIENSYSWKKYQNEYRNQMEVLVSKRASGQIKLETMENFSKWYLAEFPGISPEHIIIADDPLGGEGKVVWYMNPYYRVGWFYNNVGSVFRDIRQYINGTEEPCLQKSCREINFATFATRVLDEVTYGRNFIVDRGKISDFQIKKDGEKFVQTYRNEAGVQKVIEYYPRDIGINGKIYTIDGIILEATNLQKEKDDSREYPLELYQKLSRPLIDVFFNGFKYLLFIFFAVFVPGYLFLRKQDNNFGSKLFLSLCLGLVMLTLVSFIFGYLKIIWLNYIYILGSLGIFLKSKFYKDFKSMRFKISSLGWISVLMILLGSFFQTVSMFRSGWVYPFGVGFWGPIGHDGVWHQALVNQLIKSVPPESPIFSSHELSNYHYFYNLLVAVTAQISTVPTMDLIYRFYPIIFSLMLGAGTYLLTQKMFNSKLATTISLFFVYFGSSFGWIVEYIRENKLGGESTFWVNQPVSFNLNPPFAISLIFLIGLILFLKSYIDKPSLFRAIPVILIAGSLITFKAYAGIIVLGALFIVSVFELIIKKEGNLFKIFAPSIFLSLVVFLPQNKGSAGLLVFSPLWFLHSMIDYSDRVGWLKLSQARVAYFERGEWLKYILAEGLGFLIFVLGNLGTRLIGFFALLFIFKKKYINNLTYLFILTSSLIAFITPFFFIQKGNPWNTIQFFYYFLYFCSLAAGIVYAKLFNRLPKLISALIMIILLFLTPISVYTTFKSGLGNHPPSRIGLYELEGLKLLRTRPYGVVLTPNFDKSLRQRFSDPYPLSVYESTAYVSAFSEKPVFLEDELQHEIFQTDYKSRLVAINDFFKGRDSEWSKQFIKENNIKYIYIPKLYNISLDSDKLNLENIFENEDIIIYETNI